MDLDRKIADAKTLIERVLRVYHKPIVMSSFGKDSMVLLWLLKSMGSKLPILFHREPFFPDKYEFANRIIQQEDFTVYDYPPSSTGVIKNNTHIEIVNFYDIGGGRVAYLPTGIRDFLPTIPYLCGLGDLYQKPTGNFSFPWDLAFVGHKSTDCDPMFGNVPLKVDVKLNPGSCNYAFPLRHFTDEDVWEYHRRFDVPVNEKRYDPENGFRERRSIRFNPDYHYACTRCMDRDGLQSVLCPLIGGEVTNISGLLRYVEFGDLPDYFAQEDRPFALQPGVEEAMAANTRELEGQVHAGGES
jgi:3'-phosphoadenosine 5'-phosphosulfate sulfotransferase (PAPS reductase)/FAD synthetase